MTRTTLSLIAAAGTIAPGLAAHAQVDAAPTKSNGDYIAGSGIPADTFLADESDVSVYLKARARDNGDPIKLEGNTYLVLDGPSMTNPSADWWSFDFQFTPRPGDTIDGTNYILTLEFDRDPTAGIDFIVISLPLFDDDILPINSWDDGDGLKANPGPGAWSDDSINYVYSQSWRPNFGFLLGMFSTPGDYQIRFSAAPADGNIAARTVSTTANVRVLPAADTSLTLDAQDDCLDATENQLVVDINLANAQDTIVGGQFFLQYDNTKLDFVSADTGDAPFSTEVFENVDEVAGEIDYAVGIPLGGTGTDDATTMARLTFDVLGDYCFEDALVSFRTGVLPTRVTDSTGMDVQPNTVDLGVTTKDSVAPTITAPGDLFAFADAGTCGAVFDPVETFDTDPPIAAAQAPGVWYTDRYAPAAFESVFFDGDDRLRIGISDADSEANRPASFSSVFYNTQGRKLDVDIPVGEKISADLYIPSDWATSVRRSDLWATTFNSGNAISGFPILGFINNDPNDPFNIAPAPVDLDPRFRFFVQDTDFDPSNGFTADWIEFPLPSGFSYDRWWTFEIELTPAAYLIRVIDDTGTAVIEFADPVTFGSIRFGNIIMQAYNFGETYDAIWDNIITGPAGPVATDDCSNLTLTFERSDDNQLGLGDPFPAGQTTTVTWTATDACGNSASDSYLVTVDGDSLLDVAVELQAVVDPGPFERCITFELVPAVGPTISVDRTLTFVNGVAVDTVEVPCGDYNCITARDTLHSLRKTDQDDFGIVGTNYAADFTTSGSLGDDDSLTGGNLNDDTFIDILDFGILIGQFGASLPVDTACGTVGPHADISGDGSVTSGDFAFIQINFLDFSEARCDGSILLNTSANRNTAARPVPLTQPLTTVSLDQLDAMGLAHLGSADLNRDAQLSEADIVAFLNGARPDHVADVDRSGRVDFFDLAALTHFLNKPGLLPDNSPYDMNGDRIVTIEDLLFVRDRLGQTFGN